MLRDISDALKRQLNGPTHLLISRSHTSLRRLPNARVFTLASMVFTIFKPSLSAASGA
jgi:hypothetical protein